MSRSHSIPVESETMLSLIREFAAESPGPGVRHAGIALARTLLRIRNRDGVVRPLHANPAQQLYERRRGLGNIILKARQMGFTTWIAGRFFLKTVTCPGTLSVQVAHTREAAEAIFAVVERMWENLPPCFAEGCRRSRANSGQMVFSTLDSEFRVVSAGEAAAGRGLTIQNLHLSEVSRWPGDARATLAGLRAALAPAGEITLESTPHGACGAFYEEWQQAPGNGLRRHFFPWWMEPAYIAEPATSLTPEENALVHGEGLSLAQIGFRRTLERGFRGLRAQEFAEDSDSCFKASGDCCLPVAAIDRRIALVPDPVEVRRNGALHVWLPPVQGRDYILGVDSAGGGPDGDFAAIQVVECWTGLQCAELRERLPPLELARAAASLAREYRNATIAVERNNHGAAVLAYLDAVERYPRIYAQRSPGSRLPGTPGFLTTTASKPAMIGRLGALLEEAPMLFASRRLLAECRTFLSLAGGATGAAPGAHDDCLMAMAVAHAVRAETASYR